MSRSLEEIRAHREEILAIAKRHGAYNVRVFGSTVRGSTTRHSDVDFLVSLEPGRSLLDQAGLLVELEDLLESPVDVVLDRSLRPFLRDDVMGEAIELRAMTLSASETSSNPSITSRFPCGCRNRLEGCSGGPSGAQEKS